MATLSPKEQRLSLRALASSKGYGILCLYHRPGDVEFAISPVPKLKDYEIVSACKHREYDIWKNGKLHKPDQSHEQVVDWVRSNTPVWLYDDSKPTDEQKQQLLSWVADMQSRYPGAIMVS